MTYTKADIETMRAREQMFRARMEAAKAGESFGGPDDYQSFMGQWRENSRRLGIALAQQRVA